MKNKGRVLVVGGSGGIGMQVGDYLVAENFEVFFTYCRHSQTCINRNWIHIDLLNLDEEVIRNLSGFDYLIFASGISNPNSLIDEGISDIINILNVTCISPLRMIQLLSQKNKLKKIIFISSIAGCLELKKGTYAYSKACLNTMVEILANELLSKQISVNAIAPGWCNTKMAKEVLDLNDSTIQQECANTYDGKIIDPLEIARLCAFLLSEADNHITGQIFKINSASK